MEMKGIKEIRDPELTEPLIKKETCAIENAQPSPHDEDNTTEGGKQQEGRLLGGRVTREWMGEHIDGLKQERESEKNHLKLATLTLKRKSPPEGIAQTVAQHEANIERLNTEKAGIEA